MSSYLDPILHNQLTPPELDLKLSLFTFLLVRRKGILFYLILHKEFKPHELCRVHLVQLSKGVDDQAHDSVQWLQLLGRRQSGQHV